MAKLPKPAQYLLRIDDLCPTVDAMRWQRVRAMIQRFHIRSILAVIPDNQDPDLHASPPDPAFWQQMREMEHAGATIGLHGYQHLCTHESDAGLVRIHRSSEFAGVPYQTQKSWIARGLEILRKQGLHPKLFVAPRHGFDGNTLAAIAELDIPFLSDGLARVPFLHGGVTWVPMQLWSPVRQQKGLWTICVHPNTTDDSRFAELQAFLEEEAAQFTSFERIARESPAARLDYFERIYEFVATQRLRLHHALAQRGISSRRS